MHAQLATGAFNHLGVGEVRVAAGDRMVGATTRPSAERVSNSVIDLGRNRSRAEMQVATRSQPARVKLWPPVQPVDALRVSRPR